MSHFFRLSLVPVYLMLCLMLGGASAAGYWSNMLLQLLAIPIIFWAFLIERHTPMPSAAKQLLAILMSMLLVICVQLIPLPPSIWAFLPNREHIAEGYTLLNQPLPWLPLSLAPHQTIASTLWLLPAIAVLLGIVRLGFFKPRWLAWVIGLVTTLGVLIGAMQVTSGDTRASPWYFYEITNFGFATGFFSNANHMATLLVVAIPFLTALFLETRARARSAQSASGMFVILVVALTVVMVGIVINNSLAVIGLAAPVIAASLLMIRSNQKKLPKWALPLLIVLSIASVSIVFTTPFQNNLTTKGVETSSLSRYTSFTNSIQAVKDFAPVGSGIGTFVQIYPSYENVAAAERTYINHVHSDYIELALETGIAGLAVLVGFLAWWGRRIFVIWGAADPDYYACAATIASAAILAHSAVDYPLRTAAISAVFAMCCGLMADPRARANRRKNAAQARRAKHLSAG